MGFRIVVEGERISTVGGADIPARGDATVIDLKGQTVREYRSARHHDGRGMLAVVPRCRCDDCPRRGRQAGEGAPAPGQSEQRRATRPAAVCAWSAVDG